MRSRSPDYMHSRSAEERRADREAGYFNRIVEDVEIDKLLEEKAILEARIKHIDARIRELKD